MARNTKDCQEIDRLSGSCKERGDKGRGVEKERGGKGGKWRKREGDRGGGKGE